MYFTNLNSIDFHQALALSTLLQNYASKCSTYPIEGIGYSVYFNMPCSFIQLNNGIRMISAKGEQPTYVIEDTDGLEYELDTFEQAVNYLEKIN